MFWKLYRRHILILISCCGMVAASVGLCVNAYGVFYTPICDSLGVGRAAVTVHATISGILTGLLSPCVVRLLDKRVSIRRLACFGAALSSLSFVGMACANRIWLLNLCGIVRGVGNSCFYMPVVTIVLGNWFKKNQGTITGAVMAFSGIAGAVLSPLLTSIIASHGYRAASLFGAALVAVLSIPPCALFLRLAPSDFGVQPYGSAEDIPQARTPHRINRFSFCSPVFFLLAGMTFLAVFLTGLTSHLPGYSENLGAGSTVGAAMISAVMAGNILAKFSSGLLSDQIGVYRAFSIMFVISLTGIALLYFVKTDVTLLIASFLFGTIYAPSAVGLPSIVRHIYGDKQYGQAYSIISMISVIAPSISMILIGGIYDWMGNYRVILLMCLLFGILALLLWNLAGRAAERRNEEVDA